MDDNYKIFVVDDDETTRLLLQSILADKYAVELFDSAEGCLARVAETRPQLYLLDVGLPGIDGYELCRRIKERPDSSDIPVIFISGHDGLEDALAGYDAGGEDYVVKPFDVVSFFHKIENLRRIERDRKALVNQATASDELANLMLANLDEYAVLIKFLRTLNECRSYQEVADATLRALGMFRLDGAVQVRMRSLEKTFSKAGENWPLEIAVINHVRSLETVFEFKQRAAFNFEHLTVLVTNMPIDDAELCGRVRDNVAIAAESANAKLEALQAFEDNGHMREDIRRLVQAIDEELRAYGRRYDGARYEGAEYTARFLDDLLAAVAHLGMSGTQEDAILGLVRERANGLVDIYDVAGATQATLGELSRRLESILTSTERRSA